MATLQTLRKYLGNYGGLNDTYDSEDSHRLPKAERTRIINETIAQLCRTYNMTALETSTTLTTSIGTASYSQPSGALTYYRIWRTNEGDEDILTAYRSKADFDLDYPSTEDSGDPEAWVIWNNKIYLGPTPSSVIAYTVDYYGQLTNLALDSDTNYFTENEPMLIVYKALAMHGASYACEPARIQEWAEIASSLENNFAVRAPRLLGSASRPVSEEP